MVDNLLTFDTMGFGKNKTGVIIKEDISQALGALGGGSAILIATGQGTMLSAFRMLKSKIAGQVTGLTSGEAKGQLMLGIANGNLTLAEIEAAIESNGPVDRSDRVLTELAERAVFYIGRFMPPGVVATDFMFGDFEPKVRWSFGETDGWNFFVHNLDATALTTGATVRLKATHFGVWIGDA